MISFYLFLLSFFLEGVAILNRELVFFLYSLIPAFYYLEKEFKKETIFLPKKIFISYFLFILFSFFSFYFSSDRINTINHLFFYIASFFVLIIGFNEKEKILKNLKKILIFFGGVFCCLSLLPKEIFTPTAYQLIFPLYSNHNHLGDFVGIPLIWLFYDWINRKDKIDLLVFFLFLPFFIFSFSRSAYLDFLIIASFIFLKNKNLNHQKRKIVLSLLIGIFLFFILTQREIYQIKPLDQLPLLFKKIINFEPRSFFSGRPEYFSQGIKGFLERPFFGWGLGNYIYPSQKYVSQNLSQVSSALNLPLTLLAEVGIFGFFLFLFFVILIIKEINYQEKPIYFLFFYLSLNFLTDYTYSIYGLFLFWFLILGLSIKEKKANLTNLYSIFSLLTLIFLFLKINGLIFTQLGLPKLGFYFFPFNHQAYQELISQKTNEGEIIVAKKIAESYYKNSSFSFSALTFLTNFYENLGEKKQALFFAQKLTDNNRFPPFDALKKTYELKKEVEGKKKADYYFSKFFYDLKTVFWMNKSFEDEIYKFCFNENIFYCRYRYYSAPEKKAVEKTNKNDPYQATYTLNNDGLNERFDYQIKKPKDVFRIIVIGDGNAFGFLVNTKDNWIEKLEDLLNEEQEKKYKKVEVINLAYHSFDLAYQVERFRRQGIKYKPDLVIWMINDFSRINEIFLPLTEKYRWITQSKEELKKYQKQGKYFPSWDLAWEEYQKKIKEEKINVESFQKEKIKEFFELYHGPAVFVSLYDIPGFVKEELLSHKNVYFLNPKDFPQNQSYYFEKVKAINPLGHQKLAEIIFEFVKEIM
jgi:O-antigen ligase